jgi:hypothetical protein
MAYSPASSLTHFVTVTTNEQPKTRGRVKRACTWEYVSRDVFLRAAGRFGWQGCRPDARSRSPGRYGPAHKDVLPTVQSLPESAVSIAPLGPVAFGGFFVAQSEL